MSASLEPCPPHHTVDSNWKCPFLGRILAPEVSGRQYILAFNPTQFKFNLFLFLVWVRECRQYGAHSSKGHGGVKG